MKTKLLFLFTVLFFCGCSPQKRIARIAEKYNLKTLETIVYKDTIYIPERVYVFDTQIDTAGSFYYKTDTITVQGKIKKDSVYIKFTTKADTVYIEKSINIETIKVQKIKKTKGIAWGKIAGVCIVFAFLLVAGRYFLDKKNNN
jgi:hypothetical protein